MKAIVIGSGFGGLLTSVRLAAAGHHVVVLEKNPVVGGKVAELAEAGYRFDLGPTTLVMPQQIDDVFVLAGTSLAGELQRVRIDPQVRYRWPNGSALDVPDDADVTAAAVEQFSPGAGGEWRAFATNAEAIWATVESELMAPPRPSGALTGRWSASATAKRLDGKRTLAKASSASFTDPRLQQLLNRYASYAGSSPYRAPATLAGWVHVEQSSGVWHVVGGLRRLIEALERVATSMGVELRPGTDVGRVVTERGAVSGVELADGGSESADVVVANVDAAHLLTELSPDLERAKRLDRAGLSASAFVLCVAVRGRTEGIAHENVFFPLHDRQEYRYLEAGQVPIDQTVTATVSSVTDPTMAPDSGENWRIMVQLPPAVGVDRKLMSAAVLNRLAERGFDLRERIEFTRSVVPADFDARYRAPGGALYGTASNDRRSALERPANSTSVDGLYLVGGTAHPGVGLPFTAAGAELVAGLIAERDA